MRRLPLLALAAAAAAAAAACHAPRVAPPPGCAPPADAAPLDSIALKPLLPQLAGTYELTSVTTTPGWGGDVSRARLRLVALDSAHQYAERWGLRNTRRVWRPLAGRYETVDEGRTWADTVEAGPLGLSVGCVTCLDASPSWYRITAVSATGFAGRWGNPQSGIAVAIDEKGRRLPNPEGYFCARRLDRTFPAPHSP